MRTPLIFIFACVALAAYPALAQVDSEVTVTLTGGTLTTRDGRSGTAEVEALLTNNGSRALNAVRIGVFYNDNNSGPPPGVAWIPHEFVLEPPLTPGSSTTLRFTDDNAGEYVLIEIQRILYGSGLSLNGSMVELNYPLKNTDGAVFIATRDLASLSGMELKYDDASGLVTLLGEGRRIEFTLGSPTVISGGIRTELSALPYNDGGISYVPLEAFAGFAGLEANYDRSSNLIELSNGE